MASKSAVARKINTFIPIRKLVAAVSLLAFFIVVIACIRAETSFNTMLMRAFVVMLVIKIFNVIIITILNTYEGMSSGKK